MIQINSVQRLIEIQQSKNTQLGLILNPRINELPLAIQRFDDPFFPFSKSIVSATRHLVCAYVFDLAAYLSIGAAGAVALERSIRFAAADAVTILHAPFVGKGFSDMMDRTGFGVDALTLWRDDDLPHYLAYPPYAAAVMNGAEHLTVQDHSGEKATIRLAPFNTISQNRTDRFTDHVVTVLKGLR